MVKLKVEADPTFTAKVEVPMAGGKVGEANFTFKHRTKTEINEWLQAREGKADVDSFMEMVVGWDMDAPFDRENVEKLLQNHISAALETYRVYVRELVEAKVKN